MQTVEYIEVQSRTANLAGLDSANISTEDFRSLRDGHDLRLRRAFLAFWWPFYRHVEQRWFRPFWDSSTTYAAGQERYHAGSDKYYVALKASTNQAPADSAGVVNDAYWALCNQTPAAGEWDATKTYAVAEQAAYAGTIYQLHTAAVAGTLPTDATKWGELPPFERTIDFEQTGETAIGRVREIWTGNPDATTRRQVLDWDTDSAGIIVRNGGTSCWVEFQERAPRLFGEVHDDARSYAAGRQVYFSAGFTSNFPGNFYTAATAIGTNTDPSDDTTNWVKVEIPLDFALFLEYGAASDWLRANGQPEDANLREAEAARMLEEAIAIWSDQSNTRRVRR